MLREGRGKGYVGNRMSVNARNAHMNDELPMSHWSKKKIMEVIEDNEIEVVSNFSKLTLSQMKDEFLDNTSWHHTGSLYNVTDFYTLNLERIAEFTKEEVKELIENRKAHLETTKLERQKKVKEREIRRNERERKEYIGTFLKLTDYKTENGLVKAIDAGRVSLEELEVKKEKAINEKREQLRAIWSKDPKATRVLGLINDDEFIYSYV